MKIGTLLRNIGFSKNAEKIYTALLTRGEKNITELSRITGLYRPIIYKTLPKLLEHNLVSIVKNGKRILYIAESPHILTTITKQRAATLETELPYYMNLFLNRSERPKFTVYEGSNGIKSVYEYIVSTAKKGEIIYRYESPKDYKKIKEYYPELYWQRAGRTGDIEKYVITNEYTHEKRSKNLNRASRAIPRSYDTFDYNITEIISTNKVAFIDFDSETAILIENQRFAEFQRKLFQLFFKKL